MEILLAAALPNLVLWIIAVRLAPRGDELRRAALLFIVLTAIWFAPCWLTQSTPVPLDYLPQVTPWKDLRPAGYLQKNPLLVDIPLQMMPWHEAVRRAVADGELPLLGRYSGSGQPLWENQQAAILYPVTLAGLLFSTFAWALFSSVSKVLLALVGTYLLVRSLGSRHGAAVLAAIAYGFGAFNITYLMFPHTNVTALAPLLLVAMQRLARRGDWRSAGQMALLIFLMLAGGHPESVLHAAFLAVPFAGLLLARLWPARERWRTAMMMTAGGAVALLLAAPFLVPFRAYLPHSQRMVDIATEPGFVSTPPFEAETFVAFLVPNYFGNPRVHNYRHAYNFNEMASQYAGLATLALAIAAALAAPRKNAFWIATAGVMLILSTQPLPLYHFLEGVPILGISAHSRLRFVLSLITAILGAQGFDLLLEGRKRGLLAWTAAVACAAVVAICIFSYPVFARYGIRRLIFFTELAALTGTAAIFVAARFGRPSLARALPFLLFVDLFTVTGLYNPALPRSLAYPETPAIRVMQQGERPYRVSGIGRALMPNTAEFFGLEDIRPQRSDPLAFMPYVGLLEKGGFDRSDYFGEFHGVPRRALLDFLGARYVVAPAGWTGAGGLEWAWRGEDAVVLRNPTALPRFFIPQEVRKSPDPAGALLESSNARTVFSDEAHAVTGGRVHLLRHRRGSSVLAVENREETFVASSEVALPGWRLMRNGSEWPLVKINGAFLGWRVPAGGGTFALDYRPVGLTAGAAAALAGIAALLVMLTRPGILHAVEHERDS